MHRIIEEIHETSLLSSRPMVFDPLCKEQESCEDNQLGGDVQVGGDDQLGEDDQLGRDDQVGGDKRDRKGKMIGGRR